VAVLQGAAFCLLLLSIRAMPLVRDGGVEVADQRGTRKACAANTFGGPILRAGVSQP